MSNRNSDQKYIVLKSFQYPRKANLHYNFCKLINQAYIIATQSGKHYYVLLDMWPTTHNITKGGQELIKRLFQNEIEYTFANVKRPKNIEIWHNTHETSSSISYILKPRLIILLEKLYRISQYYIQPWDLSFNNTK